MENIFWPKISEFFERLVEFSNSHRSLLVEVDEKHIMLVFQILKDGKRYSFRDRFRLDAVESKDLDKALDWMIDQADRLHCSPTSHVGGD